MYSVRLDKSRGWIPPFLPLNKTKEMLHFYTSEILKSVLQVGIDVFLFLCIEL